MNNFGSILKKVTVNSKDDGEKFVVLDRVNAIKELLAGSDYQLIAEGNLCLLYAKRPIENETVVLISSHIDSMHSKSFAEEDGEFWKGTFDNSITNAAVLYDMLHDQFADNVVIAFTGDEEHDSLGIDEAVNTIQDEMDCDIEFTIVTEVTSEGWEEKCPFTIENDFHVDMLTAHRVVDVLLGSFDFLFVHHAEPDECWDLDEMEIPCFTLSLPVSGDMHSDEGVLARKADLAPYCTALAAAAELVSGIPMDEDEISSDEE